MSKVYFTPEGYEQFLEKLEDKQGNIKQLQSELSDMASEGGNDWHDNFSFEQQQRKINMRSDDLKIAKKVLANAVVVDIPADPDKVCIGANIELKRNEKKEEWRIGGYGESNPTERVAAYNTPIGQALMHAEEGDTVHFRDQEIEILSIY